MTIQTRGWRSDQVGDAIQLTLVDAELQAPGSDEVVIAVEAAVLGEVETCSTSNFIAGGACVGTVTETGDAASALLNSRVVVGPVIPCGECEVCRRGAAAACAHRTVLGSDRHGTLASHVVVGARWVCQLQDGLDVPSPTAALLAREAVGAYGLFVRAGVGPGEPVVILGENTIARLLADIAVAKGACPLVVSRADAEWNDWLRTRGAVPVNRTSDGDGHGEGDSDCLRELLKQAAADAGHGARPWRIFVTSATPRDRNAAIELAGPGATVTLLGPPTVPTQDQVSVDLSRLLSKDVTMISVAAGHPDLIPEVAALATRGDLNLDHAARIISTDQIEPEAQRMQSGAPETTLPVVAF